jgi:hypothetical protein
MQTFPTKLKTQVAGAEFFQAIAAARPAARAHPLAAVDFAI